MEGFFSGLFLLAYLFMNLFIFPQGTTASSYYYSDNDIFVNCDWVNTRWQWYSTHDQYIGQHK